MDSPFTAADNLPLIACDDMPYLCECRRCDDLRRARIREAAARILIGRRLPVAYDSSAPPPANDNCTAQTLRPPALRARHG